MTPNNWAMCCHLLGLAGYLGNGIGSVIGPLIIWLLKKDEIPEVDRHGKAALNFNLSVFIYGTVLVMLTFLSFGFGALLTAPLLMALWVFHLVCVILASVRASQGREYEYPLCLRLVK